MENLPKISIITPSFNQGQFLEETILSVLGQNYPDLEYIIIDGGSTDNSLEIIKKYADKLAYWVSEKDEGQSQAINKGFDKSTGDILMWLNSDDLLMPNVLKFISQCVMQNGDGLYFGNCIHFKEDSNGLWCNGSNVEHSYNKLSLYDVAYIIQPSSFWTRAVWMKTGLLNENMHYAFDWEWFIRVKRNGINLYPVNRALSIYRFHPAHKTSSGNDLRKNEILHMYKQYSPHHTELWETLVKESFGFNHILQKIYAVQCKILGKEYTMASALRALKSKKYKKYTPEEIDEILLMVDYTKSSLKY